jgi:hypothetical protein
LMQKNFSFDNLNFLESYLDLDTIEYNATKNIASL